MQRFQKNRRLIAAAAVLVLAAVLILLAIRGCSSQKTTDTTDYTAGITRLQAMENRDPKEIDETIKENRRQELVAMRNERLAQLESGEISVWSLMQDYIILGDSRGAGFKFIYQLDEHRNLATYGNTADHIPEYYDTVAAMNPAYIILIFGFNDMLHPQCHTPEGYIDYFIPIIEDLKAHFPDAKVLVNPIFPAVGAGLNRYEEWTNTPPYDAAMREIAKRTGVYYVNCDDIEMTPELYQEDGLHFTNEFMEMWATRMMMTIYDAETGLSSNGDEPGEDSGMPQNGAVPEDGTEASTEE